MSGDLVTYACEGEVGVVSLNRPEKLNALSMPMRLDLERKLLEADADPQASVVLLRGEGRAFCVGFDLERKQGEKASHPDALRYRERLSVSLRALMTPWTMSKPVIASVQGYALGGGCELALFCDLAIAAESTQFGEPEILFSQAGPGLVLPFLIGVRRAREMLYFGDRIGAHEAMTLGLVNRVVADDQLPGAAMAYAKRLARVGSEALATMKLAINRGADARGFSNAIRAGCDAVAPLYASVTPTKAKFDAVRARDGLKAALAWRHRQMQD